MLEVLAAIAVASTASWTIGADGYSASIEQAGHRSVIACSRDALLSVEIDAPPGTDRVTLIGREGTLNLAGRTVDGRFVSMMPNDGISVLFLRDGGLLKVGSGPEGFTLTLDETAPVVDRLVNACAAKA